jgi:hypothetical protein
LLDSAGAPLSAAVEDIFLSLAVALVADKRFG